MGAVRALMGCCLMALTPRENSSMKSLTSAVLLALALTTGACEQAQTFEQSHAAYERKDYRTAFTGFKKLAEQGDAMAQLILGQMYRNGRSVPKDDQQAVVWYRKAAEQGDAMAQYNLGVMYSFGEGVPKNDQQAVAWYRKAAEQGLDMAQYNLGWVYAFGRGVPKDEQSAYFWWLLASAQGHQGAVKNRDMMERRLSPEQRTAAQAAARDWKPKTAERHEFKWAFAQNADGTFQPNEFCRESLAESIYAPGNQGKLEREGESNVFVFRGGSIETYKVYAFRTRSDCEVVLSGIKARQRP